jgi:hypothetical protein
MIPHILEKFLGPNYRTTLFGLTTLGLLGASVAAPHYGVELDFTRLCIGILALAAIFQADAAQVLNVRKFLEEAKK